MEMHRPDRDATLSSTIIALLCLAATALLPTSADAAEIPFAAPTVVDSVAARTFVVADFDRDGDQDVAAVVDAADYMVWFRADGSTLTRLDILPGLEGIVDLEAADVDCDGDLDLVFAEGAADRVRWAENSGTGIWSPGGVIAPMGTAGGPRDLAVADFDQDGAPDVVATQFDAEKIVVYRNPGCGGGGVWNQLEVDEGMGTPSPGGLPVHVAAGDVNGDGRADIVTGLAGGGVAYYEHPGSMSWDPPSIIAILIALRGVAAGDVSGDGTPDIVAAADGEVLLWEHIGPGPTFDEKPISEAAGASAVLLTDLDRDADLDVAFTRAAIAEGAPAGGGTGSVGWWENSGEGVWVERIVDDAGIAGPVALASFDLGRDGDLDLLDSGAGLFLGGGSILAYESPHIHRNAAFPVHLYTPYPFALPGTLADLQSGDVDGDGDLDVVTIAGDTASWFANHSADADSPLSFVGPTTVFEEPFDNLLESVALGDFDGDGDLDAFVGVRSSVAVGAYLCDNGGGTPVAWSCSGIDSTGLTNVSVGGAADLDDDGDLDVAVSYQEGSDFKTAWWRNDRGSSPPWSRHVIDISGSLKQVRVGDLSGDGTPDIVASDGDWFEWTFVDPQAWILHSVPDLLGAPAIGDVDRDGDLDLAAPEFDPIDGIRLAWFENDLSGTGTWISHPVWEPTSGSAPAVARAFADLDLDGDLDLVSGVVGTLDHVSWFENDVDNGSGPWTERVIEPALFGPAVLTAGDYDRDGDPDVLGSAAADLTSWVNGGGQFSIEEVDVAPDALGSGGEAALLRLDVAHHGRAGDSDLEVAELALFFQETPGDPLDQSEIDALVAGVRIVLDDGDGTFEDGIDLDILNVGAPILTAGVARLVLPDDDPDLRQPPGTSASYFVVVELTADATAAGLDVMTVSHSAAELGTVAEDADFDLPLLPEWSILEGVTVQITDAIFADGFESGDTTAWSSTTP